MGLLNGEILKKNTKMAPATIISILLKVAYSDRTTKKRPLGIRWGKSHEIWP